MKIGIYSGSFDPVTNGHIDIIERASKIVDKLIVAILVNKTKKPCFTIEEKIEMLKIVTGDLKNVEIDLHDGLLVRYANKKNAFTIIRGIREITDFEYELQMNRVNSALCESENLSTVESIYLFAKPEYSYLSSSAVREVASFGGDISMFVPKSIEEQIKNKFK